MRRAWCRSPSKVSTVSTRCSRTRGPAIAPSLLTWPTSTVVSPRSLAMAASWRAHSLTWATVPGAEPSAGSAMVCMESTTTTSGSSSPTAPTMAGSDPAGNSHRSGSRAPRRSARSLTCWEDSSAETSRQRAPERASAPSICTTKVDLPMPGSPATRVTEPGTRPPASTRSSSSSPVGLLRPATRSTHETGWGPGRAPAPRPPPSPVPGAGTGTRGGSRSSSTRAFHALHVGQRPDQRGASAPHSAQRWTG